MQIESLKMFCDLVDTESFTKAAQISHVTQSAVSQQVAAMERQFRCLLLERSKKQLRLTREGLALYEAARRILQSYDEMESSMQEIKGVISGRLHVVTVYSIGLHDLPPYLKQFMKSCPAVSVRVEFRRSNKVYDDVARGMADLGLVAFPHKTSQVDIIPLHKYAMSLISHPQHPLAGRKSVRLTDLEGQRFVSFQPDMPTRKAVDKVLRENGITVQHVMEVDNVETVKQAVEINAGLAIVPHSTVRQEVGNGTLAEMRIEGADLDRPWAVAHRKGRMLTPAMRHFIATLQAKT